MSIYHLECNKLVQVHNKGDINMQVTIKIFLGIGRNITIALVTNTTSKMYSSDSL